MRPIGASWFEISVAGVALGRLYRSSVLAAYNENAEINRTISESQAPGECREKIFPHLFQALDFLGSPKAGWRRQVLLLAETLPGECERKQHF